MTARTTWLLLLALMLLTCARHTPDAQVEQRPTVEIHRGPPTDYVPAAGLRWLLAGEPGAIARDKEAMRILTRVLPKQRLDAFALKTGIDLRATRSAAIAQFDLGSLYLAASRQPEDARQRFVDRLLTAPKVETDEAELWRATGVVGQVPQSFLSIRRHLVAVAVGDPTLTKVAELYARKQLRRSPVALRGAALRTLPSSADGFQIRFLVPGPITGDWAGAGDGLLAAATAVGVYGRVRGASLTVRIVLAGAWQPEDMTHVETTWLELRRSRFGRLLGLDEPLRPPSTQFKPSQLEFAVQLALAPLISGLHAAVAADIWEIMDLSRSGAEAERSTDTSIRQARDAGVER